MQNPLLDLEHFAKFCASSAAALGLWRYPEKALAYLRRNKFLRPIETINRCAYFSPFQIWLVAKAGVEPRLRKGFLEKNSEDFHRIVLLLTSIQEFYLPEVRSDLRAGHVIEQGPSFVGRGGSGFSSHSSVHLQWLRDRRCELIQEGLFDPQGLVADSGLSIDQIAHWKWRFETDADHRDPLDRWKHLVRAMPFERREELKGDARLALRFREMSELLTLCMRDCGDSRGAAIPSDWANPNFNRDADRIEESELRFFGRDALAKPYELLEFLANEFHLNPRPKALIFTEGEEWRAVRRVFLRLGMSPDLMGIEMRSLRGEGNFTKDKWRFFLEYMHEKQVFVYFALDREGRTVPRQQSLENEIRHFQVDGLSKVLPSNRVVIWDGSFEEANFSDGEIAHALSLQGLKVSRQRITAHRHSGSRRRGLISHLCEALGIVVNKSRLAEDLAGRMLLAGVGRRRSSSASQLERFVESAAELILLNHQPTVVASVARNRRSGLLG